MTIVLAYYRTLALVIAIILFLTALVAVLILSIALLDISFDLGFGYPWWIVPILVLSAAMATFLATVALRVRRHLGEGR